MKEKIEETIKQYEQELVNLVQNHTALTGALQAMKHLLLTTGEVVEIVDPEVAPIVDEAEHVVKAVVPNETSGY
jgi:hypothetical protein